MPTEHLVDEVLGLQPAVPQPFFVAADFAEVDQVKVLLPHSFGYHPLEVLLVQVLGEHVLLDAAVEAAEVEQHGWRDAKLRSVGGARGGLRSATAAITCRRRFALEKVGAYPLRLA